MNKIFFLFPILFLFVSCHEKKKTDFQTGILWQIESEKGIKSFIFGTIHIYPKTDIQLSKKVISSLEKSNVLALERKRISSHQQQKFTDIKMPNLVLERHQVIVGEYGDNLASMEMDLIIKALESDMIITGLESANESLNIIKAANDIEIDETTFVKEQALSDYKESVSQYKTGSIRKYYEISAKRMGDRMTEILVDKRNRNWIEKIEYLIEKERTFIAVGFAHLGGENGILNLLAEKGYQIKKLE